MAEELRGWKDIGAHFGASDRTAQRWEREHGMPVHRTGRTRGASVFAIPAELDAWRLSPDGLRARAENGTAAPQDGVSGGATAAPASPARRAMKVVIGAAAVVVLVLATGSYWILSRGSSPVVPASPPPKRAFTVPNSPMVFLLTVTTADGTPFTFHVLDGGMATLAPQGGPKLGFVPTWMGERAKLTAVKLQATRKGGFESLTELNEFPLAPGSVIPFEHQGMAVKIEWLSTLKSSDLPALPPGKERRDCCIISIGDRGDQLSACAAQVTAPIGSCCGFSGCMPAK